MVDSFIKPGMKVSNHTTNAHTHFDPTKTSNNNFTKTSNNFSSNDYIDDQNRSQFVQRQKKIMTENDIVFTSEIQLQSRLSDDVDPRSRKYSV